MHPLPVIAYINISDNLWCPYLDYGASYFTHLVINETYKHMKPQSSVDQLSATCSCRHIPFYYFTKITLSSSIKLFVIM
jgi:hypothetical protein